MKWFLLGVLSFLSSAVVSADRVILSEDTWKSDIKAAIAAKKDLNQYWVGNAPVFIRTLMGRLGDADIAKMIVESGYDVSITDMGGSNALSFGCAKNLEKFPETRTKVIKKLINSKDFYSTQYYTFGCLSDEGTMDILLESGVKLDINQEYLNYPMYFLLFNELPLEKFKKLMVLVPDFSIRGGNGFTESQSALHYYVDNVSSKDGKEEIHRKIVFLVEQGVNVNGRDSNTQTPLMYAVLSREVNILKSLVRSGAIIRLELKKDSSIYPRAKEGLSVIGILKSFLENENLYGRKLVTEMYVYLLEQDDLQRL